MVNKKSESPSEPSQNNEYHLRVTAELKQQGKTQQWLASQLGKQRQYLQQILKTNKRPHYVKEIAELLEVNPAWLETGAGERYIYKRMQSHPIKLYSLTELKEKKSFSAIKPIEIIYLLESHIDFAILMDDPELISPTYPEKSVLLFQRELTTFIKSIQALILYKNKNLVSLAESTQAPNQENISYKPIESKLAKLNCEAKDSIILGFLKEIRIQFY